MTAAQLIAILSTVDPDATVEVYDPSWGIGTPLTEWVIVRTESATKVRLGAEYAS
jgi:hypothetical protein